MNKRNSVNDTHSSPERKKRELEHTESGYDAAGVPEYYNEEEDFRKLDERFGNNPKNEYYAKVASGYRYAKIALVAVLVAVILFALVLGSDEFTYANLRYLLRNFGEVTNTDTELATVIEFHGDENSVCDIFNDKLAVLSGDTVSLYRLSGKKLFSEKVTQGNGATHLAVGSKYFFVWSHEYGTFDIFNSVYKIVTLESQYPVQAVAVDGVGGFALLNRNKTDLSSVEIYDGDALITATKTLANDYAVSIALSSDGNMLSTASFSTEEGEYLSKLDVSDIKNGVSLHTYTYKGEFPLETGFFGNYGFYILTDKAAYIYGASGELLIRETYSGKLSLTASNGSHVCLVCTSVGSVSANHIEVISETGRVAARFSTDSVVIDACLTEENVFLLASSVVCVSLEDGGKTDIPRRQNARSIITDGANVYCVYTGRAELIYSDGRPYSNNENN
ncbi:MAG: hypothetical protein E7619_01965 [Ruminococcaceae bacterium]|nr:hypothetical protein [Oscillospiraceae bacterium]